MNLNGTFVLNPKLYAVIKWCVQVVFPAFATFYYTIADTWNLPNAEGVAVTVTAICTFLGISLGISSYNYYKGDNQYDGVLIPDKTPQGELFKLEINEDPINFLDRKELKFKVGKAKPTSH